jgi:hypothetical protein
MNNLQRILPDDNRIAWNGVVSLEKNNEYVMPWRLPFENLDMFHNEVLHTASQRPSGVTLCFSSDTRKLKFITTPACEAGNADLYLDGQLYQTKDISAGDNSFAFENLPPGFKAFEFWPNHREPFKLKGIEIDKSASLEKPEDKRKKWITYGSSITHCQAAASPSFTWPGVVARAKGLNLISLGFAGQCHADPMIFRLIRDMPADFISVKLGINIYGRSSLHPRTFKPAVIGGIATVREKHPDIPLAVCSPIWSANRETEANSAGFTLPMMRDDVKAAVEIFSRRGDRNIHYVDGLSLFDESLSEYLPDNLHPDAEGYKILGRNFIKEVFETQRMFLY